MVVFPGGDRTRLNIACVHDSELSDWALASERQFPNTPEGETDCRTHMEVLGKKHGLSFPVKDGYLD